MSSNLPAVARLAPPFEPSASPAEPASAASAAPRDAPCAEPPDALSDCAPLEPPPDDRRAEQRWSRAKQVTFLQHLAASHSVAAAARSVGMSRQSAYRLRARLKGQPFDLAWAAAFDSVFNALAHAAMERAIHGVPVPYLHNGEVVHIGRRFDERLTLGLLKMRYALLPDEPLPMSDASAYQRDDFPGLLARVGEGPESWDDA